jgi:hypothetical protein
LRRCTSGKFEVADALPLKALLQLNDLQLEKKVIPYLKLAVT